MRPENPNNDYNSWEVNTEETDDCNTIEKLVDSFIHYNNATNSDVFRSTHMHNDNTTNNDGFRSAHVTFVMDPKLAAFLPPELRAMINNDLKQAQGEAEANREQEEEKKEPVKILFDFKMVNSNQNLRELTQKLKKAKIKQWNMLLYGVSGAGKSLFGQYLAQELKMPFIKKRTSDLTDKFVGETEKKIKEAFIEARKKKAILLLDEADSLIFDRTKAQREYEVSGVNELLTQMEDHPYPVILTTNLKEKIDTATLRRCIFKIKYDYMTADNVKAGVKTYFGSQFKLTNEQAKTLPYLCPGDFKVAKSKLDILENGEYTNELIYAYLLHEQAEKELDKGSTSIRI